ncbi:hypothetical protein Dda_4183 [Drechslerella dactyloides]|uniref:Uncharacterized protein n=1 Tax=Drechslerella dactyloides TaxID=74499 RepID=A0AAD6IZA2_DREDA|nr:hypothetical protein Dda_4183 [Drechslerella dactyloides]
MRTATANERANGCGVAGAFREWPDIIFDGFGWGSLVVGGGAAYYFAKKSIDADRREKHMQRILAQKRNEELEAIGRGETVSSSVARGVGPGGGNVPGATEGARDQLAAQLSELQEPAPTRHTPDNEDERVTSKSKFEAAQPYRARKGDRFS